MRYDVRVVGPWVPAVAVDFPDLEVTYAGTAVVLSAELDQAALHGLLERLRVHGIELIEVKRSRRPRRSGG
jgi:hypothetical protein